jgi:hypothetical protein
MEAQTDPVCGKDKNELSMTERREWESPALKILPVPSKTQTGGASIFFNDQEDAFYTLAS